MEKEKIDVLRNMCFRMKKGHLGCSGFNMKDTSIFLEAIEELDAEHQ